MYNIDSVMTAKYKLDLLARIKEEGLTPDLLKEATDCGLTALYSEDLLRRLPELTKNVH